MSTHIYAFRMKDPAQLWAFVRDTRIRGEKNVRASIRSLTRELMAVVDPNSEEYKKRADDSKPDEIIRHSIACGTIKKEAEQAFLSPFKDAFDFSVSVAFKQRDGDIYVLPFCGLGAYDALDFLKRDRRLEDFHYQNSTDKPKRISKKAWEARRDVWFGMDEDGSWLDMLTLEICSRGNFYRINPWWDDAVKLRKKYYGK